MNRLLIVFIAMLVSLAGLSSDANAQLVNLALGKPVAASQQLNATFPASNANDGNTSTSEFYHSATSQTTPFWEVDLEGSFAIEEVNLYNRADGSGNFGNRLNNIFVEVLDESDNQVFLSSIFNQWNGEGLVSEINNPGPGPHLFDISGVTGSKVRVFKESLPGSPWLALSEVEVLVNASSLTSLIVDRITGAMTLSHASGAPSNLEFLGYTISSPLGALDSTGWKSIADNYDADSGDMSVDGDDTWTILSDPNDYTDLSELQFTGTVNDGASLVPGQSVVLSEGNTGAGAAWLASNDENDLRMELALPDGSIFDVPVVYAGNGDEPLSRSDFDSNGVINSLDYLTLQSSFPSGDLSGATAALKHRQGDSDFDGDVDIDDFLNFRTDYEAAAGAGSFQALLNSVQVPEPTTLMLASILVIACTVRRSAAVRCLALALLLSLPCSSANADTLGWWRLGDEDFGAFIDDPVFETEINVASGGTFGNMTTPLIAVEPLYSDLVPGATIVDPLTNMKHLNAWSIAGQKDEIAPQVVGTVDQLIPSGAFTYEAFVRYADTSVSDGMDFARHWSGNTGFLLELTNATSQSPIFETFTATIRADNGGSASNLSLRSNTKFVDGQWYHVAVVFDGNSNDGSDDFHLFIDHKLESSGNVLDTATYGGDLAPVLTGEVVSDGTIHIDESRYRNEAASHDGSDFLRVGTLRATVNASNGQIELINDSLQTVDLSSYQIDSPLGRLVTNNQNWSSLSDQNLDSLGAGVGQSWDEGLSSDANSMGEVFLLGSTALASGASLNLGTSYSPGAIDQDLQVRYYDRALGTNVSAFVEFLLPDPSPGDFDLSGAVDGVDFLLWQRGGSPNPLSSTDLAAWQLDYGQGGGSLAAGSFESSAVPEPSTSLLVLSSLLLIGSRRFSRHQK